ncbi:GAF domain-containing protein [Guptibacillus hwajinpoensis]|uniref:GAF domain-containing protein n=1 Tax=Guptibacillus hwajinpoensis TaxID=208199 RepID=UPI001CFEE957|nr:GAF domain-containing protein [Pseudalkalibacillus hwajinpoensis]WLR60848.1 GAF domain-containing protein [Pseudalkalibacillus hwajinpoensis]
MFEVESYSGKREKDYQMVIKQLRALLDGETNQLANLANASALLNQFLTDVNWVGFYLYEKETDQLVLGPFQGLPACVRIQNGKGVCGTASKEGKTMRIGNVHDFPGHIACDAASQAEIVVPMYTSDKLLGVLDIDSPKVGRFDELDQEYLEKFTEALQDYL